jgi:uncharacterized membrane protein
VIYSGVYAVVLVLHLLAAIFLIGPLGLAGTLSARWVKDGDVGALKAGHRTTQVYSLVSIIVPVLGVGLTSMKIHDHKLWSMSQAWVGASLALFIVAIGVSLLVISPAQKKALAALEGPTADAVPTDGTEVTEPPKHVPASLDLLMGRLQAASGVQMLCWLAIVVLMVTKPGA